MNKNILICILAIAVIILGAQLYRTDKNLQTNQNTVISLQGQLLQIINNRAPAQSGTNAENSSAITLSSTDAGKTVSLSANQKFSLTLDNPGDGGYQFNNPQFDTSLVHLDTHFHTVPQNGALGNFGTDTWKFTALKSGTTDLTITAAQPWNNSEIVSSFKATLSIK